jgi:mercuric ion transport protein
MQKIVAFLMMVLLVSACQSKHSSTASSSSNSESIKFSADNLTELRFDVRGMSCTNCENTVCKSVKELPGIAEIKASYLDSFALVKFDKTKTNAESIKQAIESKGYEVKGFAESKD